MNKYGNKNNKPNRIETVHKIFAYPSKNTQN